MGRRRFIETVSSLGTSTAAASLIDKQTFDKLVDDPSKEVPRLGYLRHSKHKEVLNGEKPNREPIYYTINRDRWALTEGSYKIAKRLTNKFSSPEISAGITNQVSERKTGVIVDYEVYKNQDGSVIRSPDISLDTVKDRVPAKAQVSVSYGGKRETVENIPIRVNRSEMVRQSDVDSYFDRTIRPVPGGCEASNNKDESTDGYTLGTPTYDLSNDNRVIATAGHTYGRETGKTIFQNSNSSDNNIGKSGRYLAQGNGDAGIIQPNSNTGVKYWIAAKDSASDEYFRDVYGSATKTRCKDLAASGDAAYVQGRKTGRHFTEVIDFKPPSESNDTGYKIELGADTEGGDSGGTYFELRDSDGEGGQEAFILGIHAFGAYDSDGNLTNCSGSCMFYIEDELNLIT